MTFWELLETGAKTAEAVDETVQNVKRARNLGEVVVGRGVLTARFVERGRKMVAHLEQRAEDGNPPGIIKTVTEFCEFLSGDKSGEK